MTLTEVRRDHETVRKYIAAARKREARPGTTRRDCEGRHVIESYNATGNQHDAVA